MTVNPADSAVFGALYGSEALREVAGDHAWLQRMLDVEAALARVEARLGLIPAEAAPAITAAARAENLDMAALAVSTRNTGYPVVGLVKQLSQAAGAEAGRWTHWGATTQDILDTATVLVIRDALAIIGRDLDRVCAALAQRAEEHRGTVMAGRTHLQHALPVTFGYKCAVWLSPLLRMRERLAELRPRVLRVEFGGAVGTLASLGDRGAEVLAGLAQELDLAEPEIPWHVAHDGFAELVSWCGLLTGSLSKFATDVMLLMQTEVAEVAEPHAPGRGGSSTMPQKRNPIACEYVIAQARGVSALVPQMLAALPHDQERGTGPWQAEPLAIFQSLLLTHGALEQAVLVAEGMTVDAARMRRNLDSTGGLIMAEAVMMGLAPVLGREQAHHAVHHACDVALKEGIPLAEALSREEEVSSRLDKKKIEALTDPAGYLGATSLFIDRVLQQAAPLPRRNGKSA
ncbi:3-carboxy-cis,cis-muconate cycloisomerase [Roseomonas gilardii subsp. gilardii]|uniref:3-carboxy-cis,cis-muconate cycloisomerase n=1 Tax=Roseomonas gilardii TaxID=257708 RepID=UPI001FFA8166|nr:3-carboxy-cis,cis-muconate cycloisomerase [Roseomonas gilardii]UPG73323.1 3-carboxy-cis,cis-muconate cycloisomerase [Roseomonas gilardii subsp. gilardii]